MKLNRRTFLYGASAAAANTSSAAMMGLQDTGVTPGGPERTGMKPNIIIYISDQFRWDFVGANGRNGSSHTPNLDAFLANGTNLSHAVTNQPVCAPARSVLFTSRYATETGVWHNGPGLDKSLPTIATELRKNGYSTNYIGKWHLAANTMEDYQSWGAVKSEDRGGFLDLWEASNLLEFTSHPYEGTIWDRDGRPITYKDRYRVDFFTDRTERFLRQPQDKPFFLVISQLEPHQQNDMHQPIAPKGAAARFINSTVPDDLRAFPGTWQAQLPDYYGCIESIDNSVGRIRRILEEERLAENTIFVFVSDHGCHFMTRNQEYKRSTHSSSLRVPLIIDGPGFHRAQQINELVGIIDIAPTLLDSVGLAVPPTWKGRSMLPLVGDPKVRKNWPNEQFIQISESMTGRAICTKDWTYCVADPTGWTSGPASSNYHEYQIYDERGDPNELVNLAGRMEYREVAEELRGRLSQLMVAAGEPEPNITPAKLYP